MHAAPEFTLPAGYTVQVDGISAQAWHEVLDGFADANIYQSWAYEAQRTGDSRMSHWRLCQDGVVVAAAQLRIAKVPFVKLGVAYVRWGPMWRLRGQAVNPDVLALALASIHHEYAVKRGLTVRLLPYLLDGEDEALDAVLCADKFARLPSVTPQRTLVMNLDRSLPELRAGLDQKWRNGLNRAEKQSLQVEEGSSDELFERFVAMHTEMNQRKGFAATSSVDEFRRMQRDLPPRHQMRVFLASTESDSRQLGAAGVVCSHIGNFGVFMHGATTDAGMRTQASYLLQWRALTWLKAQGAATYNLHGINPLTNPGTYHFKAGLCGRNGVDQHYLGSYECAGAAGSQALVGLATSLRRTYRSSRVTAQQMTRRWATYLTGHSAEHTS
jgi:lipid II:glycine glycyltransferase (peptidoglycan interpeptide bridge formation enzyme)